MLPTSSEGLNEEAFKTNIEVSGTGLNMHNEYLN